MVYVATGAAGATRATGATGDNGRSWDWGLCRMVYGVWCMRLPGPPGLPELPGPPATTEDPEIAGDVVCRMVYGVW